MADDDVCVSVHLQNREKGGKTTKREEFRAKMTLRRTKKEEKV